MPEERLPVRRTAGLFAFAFAFALASCLTEILAHALGAAGARLPLVVLDPWVVRAGSLIRLPLAMGVGLLLAMPFAFAWEAGKAPERAIVPSAVVSGVVLVASAAAWFHLGRVGVLPHLGAITAGVLASSVVAMIAALALAVGVPFATVRLLPASERRFEKQAAALADAVVLALASIITVAVVAAGPAALMYGAVPPLAQFVLGLEPATPIAPEPDPHAGGRDHEHGHDHADGGAHQHHADAPDAPTFAPDPAPPDGLTRPGPEHRYLLSEGMRIEALPVDVDPTYPMCRTAAVPPPTPATRSVLLVTLEGVGLRELAQTDSLRAPMMPNLRRIADAGVSFAHVLSVSDDASSGLVSMLSGVTAQPVERFADRPALPNLPSLPRALAAMEVESAAFAGRELERGMTGRYLREIGVTRIVDADVEKILLEANDDAAAATRFMAYVDEARDQRRTFATLILSRATVASATDAIATAFGLRALDAELARIHAWYEQNERARGTILIVAGASASQVSPPGDPRTTPLARARFEVPFIVLGEGFAPAKTAEVGPRVGALYDVPATVLAALGQPVSGCFQGRNLFAEGEWPSNRLIVATAGPMQRYRYVHWGPNRWQGTATQRSVDWQVVDLVADPGLVRDLSASMGSAHEDVRTFHEVYFAMHEYLLARDRYAPPLAPAPVAALAEAPRTVGLEVLGGAGDLGAEGVATFVVPIQQAPDGTFIVHEAAPPRPLVDVLREAQGKRVVLELLGPPTPTRAFMLAAALREAPAGVEVILTTTDRIALESFRSRTSHAIWAAFDPRIPAEVAIEGARQLRAMAVVLPASLVTRAVVTRAHAAGIRVVARGVGADWDATHADVGADVLLSGDVAAVRSLPSARASARP